MLAQKMLELEGKDKIDDLELIAEIDRLEKERDPIEYEPEPIRAEYEKEKFEDQHKTVMDGYEEERLKQTDENERDEVDVFFKNKEMALERLDRVNKLNINIDSSINDDMVYISNKGQDAVDFLQRYNARIKKIKDALKKLGFGDDYVSDYTLLIGINQQIKQLIKDEDENGYKLPHNLVGLIVDYKESSDRVYKKLEDNKDEFLMENFLKLDLGMIVVDEKKTEEKEAQTDSKKEDSQHSKNNKKEDNSYSEEDRFLRERVIPIYSYGQAMQILNNVVEKLEQVIKKLDKLILLKEQELGIRQMDTDTQNNIDEDYTDNVHIYDDEGNIVYESEEHASYYYDEAVNRVYAFEEDIYMAKESSKKQDKKSKKESFGPKL